MVCTVSCLWFCSQAHFPVLPAATTTGGVGSHIRAMSAAGRIDVLQNDRGLKTCFEAANILPTWPDTFCKLHKVETLDDYVYLMDTKEWEQNLKDLLNASIDLKDNRIILSRFKAAYEGGISAIKTSQSSQKVEDSLDAVLPETTLQSVTKDFARRYGVVLDPHFDPSDALRSRIYKEFRRQTMTVLETRRVKSMMHVAVPKTTENIKLSDSLQLQLQEDESIVITTAIEYYLALRTLCNAWALAGNFEASDFDGTKRVFIIAWTRPKAMLTFASGWWWRLAKVPFSGS